MLRGAEQHRLKNNAVKLTVLITCCDYMELPCIHKDSLPLLQFDDAIVKLIEGTPLFYKYKFHIAVPVHRHSRKNDLSGEKIASAKKREIRIIITDIF